MAFRGSSNSETALPIYEKKLGISDYVDDPTPRPKFGYNRLKFRLSSRCGAQIDEPEHHTPVPASLLAVSRLVATLC